MRSGAAIGAIGTVIVGMLWFGEPATTVRMLLILAIVARHRRAEAHRMSIDEGLYAWVQEALEPLGAVTMRKMMGAADLYLDGIIFAVLDERRDLVQGGCRERGDLGRGRLRALHLHRQGRQGRDDELSPRAERRL